jgi:hypothetical protein
LAGYTVLLKATLTLSFVSVRAGAHLVTVQQLLKYGALADLAQKCVVVVTEFQATQDHTQKQHVQ